MSNRTHTITGPKWVPAVTSRAAVAAGILLIALGVAVSFSGRASAQTLTVPAGPYTSGTAISLSGTGFSVRSSGDTVEILECADPGGLPANLPVDSTTCDGSTLNPGTIYPTSTGSFGPVNYLIQTLQVANGNVVDCDATNYCVLWVGEDYNNAFSGSAAEPVAFSAPFLITPAAAGTTTTTNPAGTTTGGGPTTTVATASATGSSTTTTSPPEGAAGESAATGATSDETAEGSSSGTGSTTNAETTSGSTLALTGPPAGLPWLVLIGSLMAVSGTLVRRRLDRSSW